MSAALSLEKPVPLDVDFEGIPTILHDYPHWVLWNLRQTEHGRWTKPPFQPNGCLAKTNDETTHATYEEVTRAFQQGEYDGVGIVLREGICGIDLDHVLSPDGIIEPWAKEIVDRFTGSYIEKSPSSDGIHILVKGVLPRRGKAGPGNRLEFYDQNSPRYFTVTGHAMSEVDEITDQQEAIDWLFNIYPESKPKEHKENAEVVSLSLNTTAQSDDEIIARAKRAGNGDKFTKLFDGHFEEYPSHSDADLALCNLLAYWTQEDAQIDTLFRRSGLFRLERWDKVHSSDGATYGQMTISKALDGDSAKKGAEAGEVHRPRSEQSSADLFSNGFVQAADFMAETTSIEWLIDGVLEQGTSCMLFGASGSGKSFVALDWAGCVATGTDWHDQEVKPAAVFYIVGEGVAGFRRRMKAWEKKNDISLIGVPFHILKHPVPLSDGDSALHLSRMIEPLLPTGQPCLIIIDTLARNFGSGDENSNTDVSRLISKLDTHLRTPLNASIVIIHHSGNSEKDRARGASALKGAMDHEYRVDRRGDLRVLECTKMKDGPEDFEFHFQIEGVTLVNGDTSGVLVPVDTPTRKKTDVKLRPASVKALAALRKIMDVYGEQPDRELQQAIGLLAPPLVVPEDKWKQAAHEAGLSKDTPEAMRKAFGRAVEQLSRENLVGDYNGYFWVKT
ncbi:AAA family ATPase [Herbaspirillum sp. GCM10030257]|uniref:phage NrS-1 polymerase family protein n=1 Tax=Herbaspirillum sp. GCM10030257 TaxID=3273393 RepID=UPI00361E620F